MRNLLLATALMLTACVDTAPDGSPGPDATESDAAVAYDADQADAAGPAACAAICPTQHECADLACSCVGPLVPAQPCLGTCDETCGELGAVEVGGVWTCADPFVPHRCLP